MFKLYDCILVFGLGQKSSRAIRHMQLDLSILHRLCAFRLQLSFEAKGQLTHHLTEYRVVSADLPT